MTNLTEIANRLGIDKGTEHFEKHSYTLLYDELFNEYREKHIRLFEIGINDPRYLNSSVHLWSEYFNDLFFVGFDIKDCSRFDDEKIHTFKGDQGSMDDLNNAIEKFGSEYDIIIDDGSHLHNHQMITFNTLYKHVKSGGYYIIEDVHAHDSHLTIEQFKNGDLEFKLECNNKLLIIKKP
jgi:demethylmacrocin O-methyltransferase